jgi:hypothetical protein
MRGLHRRKRGLDPPPIGRRFAIALGLARACALRGLEHGPFAAYFLKLAGIVQDFESLHHRISMKTCRPWNRRKHRGEMRTE